MENPLKPFQDNWKHEVSIRGVKLLTIGYLFAGASVVGYVIARFLSKIFKFDKRNYEKNFKGKLKLATEIVLEMILIGIIFYLARQITQSLPFPLEGYKGWNPPSDFAGFKQSRLKEWQNPYPLAFFIIFFQDSLKAKIILPASKKTYQN